MIWTINRPTVAGWYWWRASNRRSPIVVNVVNDGYGLVVFGQDEFCNRIYQVGGEWSNEPLAEPEVAL